MAARTSVFVAWTRFAARYRSCGQRVMSFTYRAETEAATSAQYRGHLWGTRVVALVRYEQKVVSNLCPRNHVGEFLPGTCENRDENTDVAFEAVGMATPEPSDRMRGQVTSLAQH